VRIPYYVVVERFPRQNDASLRVRARAVVRSSALPRAAQAIVELPLFSLPSPAMPFNPTMKNSEVGVSDLMLFDFGKQVATLAHHLLAHHLLAARCSLQFQSVMGGPERPKGRGRLNLHGRAARCNRAAGRG
jgi:hypothetical protein